MMRGASWRLAVAALMLASVGLVACGSDDGDSSDSSGDTPADVAFLTWTLTDFQQAEVDAAEKAIVDSGGSMEVFNANLDPAKQATQCQDAVTSGRFNAIILIPVDGAASTPCVEAAKNADIPLVAFEAPIGPDRNVIEPQLDGVDGSAVYTGERAGELSAELLEKACEGIDPCRVISEIAFSADPFSVEREKGIQTAADASDNIEIVQEIEGNYDPAVTAEKLPDALRAHPDVNVVIFEGDSNAIAGLDVIDAADLDNEVIAIGDTGSRQGAQAVEDGKLFGTTGTWPAQGGAIAGEMAVSLVNGDTPDPDAVDLYEIDTPSIVTEENVAEFTPEWGAAN